MSLGCLRFIQRHVRARQAADAVFAGNGYRHPDGYIIVFYAGLGNPFI
jgi:hypothetical protein